METVTSKVEHFREQVEADWLTDETAAAWQKHYHTMREQMGGVSDALIRAAEPRPGMHVLDLASGTGEPSLRIAELVGPSGSVMATDANPAMVSALKHNAQTEGIANISAQAVDAAELPFPDNTFDLVTSRWGIMFFAEVEKSLAEIKRVLKPGGKVALAVWGAPGPGTYFGCTVVPYMKRVAEKPDPDGPGPMRFAEHGKLLRLIQEAGFIRASEEEQSVPTPWKGSPETLMSTMFELAVPFRKAVAELSPEARAEAEAEVRERLGERYDGEQVNVTAPVILVTATKP